MRFYRLFSRSRIIDLKSTTLKSALSELLDETNDLAKEKVEKQPLLKQLLSREDDVTTYLGNGVVLPHCRVKMKRSYLIYVGRCKEGLAHGSMLEYKDARLVFLLLAGTDEQQYLQLLAGLVRIFQDKEAVRRMVEAPTEQDFRDVVMAAVGEPPSRSKQKNANALQGFNRLFQKQAYLLARRARCEHFVIMSDTFTEPLSLIPELEEKKVIVVTRGASEAYIDHKAIKDTISVRAFSKVRMNQLPSAILIGMARGMFKQNEKLCCIGGRPESNTFDLMIMVNLSKEYSHVYGLQRDLIPPKVKPEVMERVLSIATELAVEGREGKPIGSMFVVGDEAEVKKYTKQLILNPFFGYKEDDRNILNPFMDETVKELSYVDGAFIIRGDGVLESAGTYIIAPSDTVEPLPGGLGTRHAAGAAISAATNCLVIVISSSTGQVTVFRQGKMIPLAVKGYEDISAT